MINLRDVRYYDQELRAMRRLLDYVVETTKVWDQLHPAERYGRLEYLGQLNRYCSVLGSGERRGELTRRQLREWRNLERLAKDAAGTIKILRELDTKGREERGSP